MNEKNTSPRYTTITSSSERMLDFEEAQKQYLELLETSNDITLKTYEATEQERRDLAHWALKLARREELYPAQKSNALVHAGAVFADSGYRRYAQGLIADALEHTGENIKWLHDATAETWRKIDQGTQAPSIAAVNLQSQVEVEEGHGYYQEESFVHMMNVMEAERRRQQKIVEAEEKAQAIANSDSIGLETGALYNPFADDHEDELAASHQ